MDQLTQFQLPKKPIQILLSFFAFSFLFSLSPFSPLFTNCIATFSSKILGYATDRNYLFLFCIGILAFLIKSSSTDHSDQDLVAKIFDYQIWGPHEVAENRELVGEEAVEFKEDKAKENDLVLTSQDENTGEETEEEEFIFSEKEEEEEGMELMSAEEVEELNKKFEEFIRKVREGMKIEAQNRLIMSY